MSEHDIAPEGPLASAIKASLEDWMEVLLLGFSPEILPAEGGPTHLSTIRLGATPPGRPFDRIYARADRQNLALTLETLTRAIERLRLGGMAELFLRHDSGAAVAEALKRLSPLLAGLEEEVLGPGLSRLHGQKDHAGATDLVGLRRHLAALEAHIPRLERWAQQQDGPVAPAVRAAIGRLGDRDRHGYLARALAAVADAPPPPFDADALASAHGHEERELPELVTRFRHLRHLSLAALRNLDEAQWTLPTTDLDGSPTSLSGLIRVWLREEDHALDDLTAKARPA